MGAFQKTILLILLFCFANTIHQAFALTQFSVISDVHLHPTLLNTKFYDTHSDTGADLWQSALYDFSNIASADDFVIVLGDLPAHRLSSTEVLNTNQKILSDLSAQLPNQPLFFVPGNNDSPGGDYHSYTDLKHGLAKTPLFDLSNNSVPAFHIQECSSTAANQACIINHGPDLRDNYFYGAYSAYPTTDHHIRLIVINSVLFSENYYTSDDFVSQNTALSEQLNWIAAQLNESSTQNEKVILAMHIPPGLDAYNNKPFWKSTATRAFVSLTLQYQDHIAAIVTGHTHFDEIRLISKLNSSTSVAVYGIPGVSTSHGNSPGYKRFMLDPETNHLDNFITYHSDETLNWRELYDYKKFFKTNCRGHDDTPSNCLQYLQTQNKLYPLIKKVYAVGHLNYHHWGHLKESITLR